MALSTSKFRSFAGRGVVLRWLAACALLAGASGSAQADEPPSPESPAPPPPEAPPPPASPLPSPPALPLPEAKQPSAEERFWSHGKSIPLGPFKLDVGAGLRLRGEGQDNFNVKRYGDGSHDVFLLERVRLEARLRFSDALQLFVQGQDAHVLGSNFSNSDFPNGSPYNNTFDLRQAYLEWTRIGGSPVGFKLGRQTIFYTDTRLMGPGEWCNVGRYDWDAAMLTWRSRALDVDVFYAFRVRNNPSGFDRDHFDYDVLGIFSTVPLGPLKLHAFYFLQMNNFPDAPSPGSFFRHSPGLSFEGVFTSGIDVSGGLVPQFGTWGERDVRALGGYAVVGYTGPVWGKPRLGVHYAYASGDADAADGTTRTFDGLFGAVDRYYGRMNLFAWMNLHDLQAAMSLCPLGPAKLEVDYHLFLLAERRDAWYYASGASQRQDATGAAGRVLGHELDVVATVKATPYARFQGGYALFVPGEFIRTTGSHALAHWAFLQALYEF
jgi:hypothetical protein